MRSSTTPPLMPSSLLAAGNSVLTCQAGGAGKGLDDENNGKRWWPELTLTIAKNLGVRSGAGCGNSNRSRLARSRRLRDRRCGGQMTGGEVCAAEQQLAAAAHTRSTSTGTGMKEAQAQRQALTLMMLPPPLSRRSSESGLPYTCSTLQAPTPALPALLVPAARSCGRASAAAGGSMAGSLLSGW
jgi:hypothetical protein